MECKPHLYAVELSGTETPVLPARAQQAPSELYARLAKGREQASAKPNETQDITHHSRGMFQNQPSPAFGTITHDRRHSRPGGADARDHGALGARDAGQDPARAVRGPGGGAGGRQPPPASPLRAAVGPRGTGLPPHAAGREDRQPEPGRPSPTGFSHDCRFPSSLFAYQYIEVWGTLEC